MFKIKIKILINKRKEKGGGNSRGWNKSEAEVQSRILQIFVIGNPKPPKPLTLFNPST